MSGLVLAVALAWLAAVPRVAGVETWKWLLGIVGLALFLFGGARRKDRPL